MATELDPEEDKKKYEIEKLKLESRKLEKELRPWFKRPLKDVNLIQIITAIAASFVAIGAIRTEYFKQQVESLKHDSVVLRNRIDSLSKERLTIEERNKDLISEMNQLSNNKTILSNNVNNLKNAISLQMHSDAFVRKAAKKNLEFSMDFIGNNIDTTKLTPKELQIIKDEIYLTYLRIGAFEKQNSNDGNRIQEWAEKYFKEQKENDSLKRVISQYKKLFKE
ncbi:MAG: hypothetical protein F9K23_12385 [Bacteroidetes bacterium]|nr:MAG: hypothetical protein F9K23_12385 [Bacteroidota bacterium]